MQGRTFRRRSASLAAALAVHAAFLALVVLSLKVSSPPPEPSAVQVSLFPRLTMSQPARRAPARAAAPAPRRAPAAPAIAQPSPITLPAAPSAPQAASPGAGADQGKLRAFLRGSLGCSQADFLKLSQAERDKCARWRQAFLHPGLQIPAPIALEKRAWFDATLASRHSELGHGAAVACGMLVDGLRLVKPKTPPHALKLGPLPCFVIPPNGPLTDEVDAEAPSRSTAAQTALILRPPDIVAQSPEPGASGP
jgi:hypothetical protein